MKRLKVCHVAAYKKLTLKKRLNNLSGLFKAIKTIFFASIFFMAILFIICLSALLDNVQIGWKDDVQQQEITTPWFVHESKDSI